MPILPFGYLSCYTYKSQKHRDACFSCFYQPILSQSRDIFFPRFSRTSHTVHSPLITFAHPPNHSWSLTIDIGSKRIFQLNILVGSTHSIIMSGQQAVTGISLTAVGPNTDPAHMDAMMQANSLGVVKNNEGNVARDQGQLDRALALHQEALELKIRGFGEESVQAAISFNALGVTYLKMGGDKLDAAEKAFSKALNVRDDTAFGGLGIGSRIDAAASRDDMARVLEAKGKMDEAKAMRLRGAAKGEVICGSNRVNPL